MHPIKCVPPGRLVSITGLLEREMGSNDNLALSTRVMVQEEKVIREKKGITRQKDRSGKSECNVSY